MEKTNITINNFGHYNPLTLKEFIDYISVILKKFSIDLSVTNSFSNKKINIVFEGHHPLYREKILQKLQNSSNIKKGIVLTEVLYGSNYLSKKYFTFNNQTLNKNINNKAFSFFYLIYLNFTFYFIQSLKKYMWGFYQRIKHESKKKNLIFKIFNKILYLIFNELDNPNGIYYWKERYNFFYSIVTNFDFIVNITGDEKQYYNKFNNCFKINFLSTGRKINKEIKSKNKKIDCLFTGQLTSYRKEILNNLKIEGIKVKYYDYLANKKRQQILKNSKIYLCLNKFKNDNLPLGTRVWHCLENEIFFVTEKNSKRKDPLDSYSLKIDNNNFVEKIKNLLNNYEYYLKHFLKNLKRYKKKIFFKNSQIINFVTYLKKLDANKH